MAKQLVTFKEFKEIITQVYGKVDYSNILNDLALLNGMQREEFRKLDIKPLEELSIKNQNTLHSYLDSKGYYDSIYEEIDN